MDKGELDPRQVLVLARRIVKAENPETYFLGRLLYDRGLADYFFLCYAYFRWVDDHVDDPAIGADEGRVFLRRQRALLHLLYQEEALPHICPQEQMLAQLVIYDLAHGSEIRQVISPMFECLAFDGGRRGHILSHEQLDWYSRALGRSYTDSQQYFIARGHRYPRGPDQYVTGTVAHRVHILRDFLSDLSFGYVNISKEDLDTYQIDLARVNDVRFRKWVRDKVRADREECRLGKTYLDRLGVWRCKLLGYLYCLRYEAVLDTIERDGCRLRESYVPGGLERLRFLGRALWTTLRVTMRHVLQSFSTVLADRVVGDGQRETI